MNVVSIRPTTQTDQPRVVELRELATAELRQIYLPSYSRHDTQLKPVQSLVAKAGTEIIGTVEYCQNGDSLYVQGLVVHPQYRCQGIARQLIEAIAEIAAQHDRLTLTLRTIKETGNATVFHKLGFHTLNESTADGFISADGRPVTMVTLHRQLDIKPAR